MKLTLTTILALALLCSCDPSPERPPTSSSSSATSSSSSAESTTGCVPHLAELGPTTFGCYCETLLVEPEQCGCVFDGETCSCPTSPCDAVTCDAPCELGEAFCECGSLRAPADSLHCAGV